MPTHRLWMKSGASGRAINFNHTAMDNIHCWVLPCFQSVLHAAGTAGLSRPAVYRHFNSRKNSSYARAGCCDRLNYRGFR